MTSSLKIADYLTTPPPPHPPSDQGHCGSFDPTLSNALCLRFLYHSRCHDPEISCQVECDGGGLVSLQSEAGGTGNHRSKCVQEGWWCSV